MIQTFAEGFLSETQHFNRITSFATLGQWFLTNLSAKLSLKARNNLRMVPTIVIAHTFSASRDTQVSYP